MHIIFSLVVYLLSLYEVSYFNAAGETKSFGQFEGKKILIVNIATGSPRVDQLAGLKQLQQQFADSLVVIAFPSNSFDNEPRTTEEIVLFCNQQYGINFLLGAKGNVTGPDKTTIFSWLADKTMNGVMNAPAIGDFQKFLIDKDGSIIGTFAPSVSPMDPKIISAITEF
jgi:glutathione peroxidase